MANESNHSRPRLVRTSNNLTELNRVFAWFKLFRLQNRKDNIIAFIAESPIVNQFLF